MVRHLYRYPKQQFNQIQTSIHPLIEWVFLWGKKMPLPNILEFIGTNVTQAGFKAAQEKLLNFLSGEAATKVELSAAVTPKADKTYVDNALTSFQNGAIKTYPTLVAANADIANIALNTKVSVLSETDGGDYYKASADATSLTKSPYDPLAQAKTDATTKANNAENNAKIHTDQEIEKLEPLVMKEVVQQDDIAFSIAFNDGTLSWLSSDPSGQPPPFVQNLLKALLTQSISESVESNIGIRDIDSGAGVGHAIAFSDGTLTDLTVDLNGQFAQFVIERIRNRLGLKVISSYSRIDVVNCLGDSLTEGGSPSPHYPQFLQTLMPNNTVVNNYGISGQESMDIAIRCGGVILAVNAGTILADASAVTFGQASKTRASDGVAINGNCRGVAKGYLAGVYGTMSMSNATFTPDSSLSNDVTVAQGTVFYPDHAKSLDKEGVLVWWSGQNDLAFGGSYIVSAPRDCAKAMVDVLIADKKRIVIVGVTTTSTTFITNVKQQNEALKTYVNDLVNAGHDAAFLDAQTMLTDSATLISLGYDPTTTANAESIAEGLIPSELTIDGVHFNSNVKTNFTAKQIKRIFARKGWL